MKYLDGVLTTEQAYQNNAFLSGDAVKVVFFAKEGQLIMAEESYFFLMSSMRKMRMYIPLSFTLEFFTELLSQALLENQIENAFVPVLVFRKRETQINAKTPVHYYFELNETENVLHIQREISLDVIKEITVNNNLLSNILTHSPENIYAEIYAHENDLDDVILLNHQKRIARSIYGNLLLLEENVIKIPKQKEGAYISPLLENLVTFLHKNKMAIIEEAELSAFESQKAEEILMVSDQKGIFSVSKIRNKEFGNSRFRAMLASWENSFGKE